MKPIKMLGLAMVAAIAAMAMLGAAGASAGVPELCKVKDQTPCTEQIALPTAVQAELQSEQAVLVAKHTFDVSCQESTVSGEAEKVEGSQIKGKITSVSWEGCTNPACISGSVKVTALQLPWTAHLQQKKPVGGVQEQNNGNFYAGPQPGEGQPGATITCTEILFPFKKFECDYKVQEKQPKDQTEETFEEGEWGKLQFIGAQPAESKQAKFVANELQLKLTRDTSGKERCGTVGAEEGNWNAEYKLTAPNNGIVDLTHQE